LSLGPQLGCRSHDGPEQPNLPADRKPVPVAPERVDLRPGEPNLPNRFQNDALWQRARGAQEIDLMLLANREGALGLLEALRVGRSVGLTALAALPHADDSALALSRLCGLLASEKDPSLPVLQAVQGIVARPPEPREAIARSGYVECLPVVERLALLQSLDPGKHDLASSAAGLLREHREAARR
jgi:hypothetical protein